MRNIPEKVMKQTYLKTDSVTEKVSTSAKSPSVMIYSVTDVVIPSNYGTDKELYPDNSPVEVGSSVSMSGRDLDRYMLRNRNTAPTFYGIFGNMTVLDDIE